MKREGLVNFAAGPAALPQSVLIRARDELLDWRGTGMSVMELPFTSAEYRGIAAEAARDVRDLLALAPGYHVLFLQGGAYGHFALLAMNLLGRRAEADYVQTGHWSCRAITEAARYGRIEIVASGEADGYRHIPPQEEWCLNSGAAYCHVTSNETANGLQFHWTPDTGRVPLVADVTSDFLTRPMDVSRYGLLYASAQKNVGIAGLTIVIIHEDLLDQAMELTPAVFNYGLQARGASTVNTPPTYALYIAGLVFSWLKGQGGLVAIEEANRRKSTHLYDTVDADDFYHCPIEPADRSLVNVCFRLPSPELEAAFLAQAAERGLVNLAGHGATGGIRASLYNCLPQTGVDALVGFMHEFSASRRDSR